MVLDIEFYKNIIRSEIHTIISDFENKTDTRIKHISIWRKGEDIIDIHLDTD